MFISASVLFHEMKNLEKFEVEKKNTYRDKDAFAS